MRVYLDCCCLQRPFDDQSQPRIRIETQALLAVLTAVESRAVSLVSSEVLAYEIGQIPDSGRRSDTLQCLALAQESLDLTADAETLAGALADLGISPMDALHLAIASIAGVDYFATCDDKLIRRCESVSAPICKVISLAQLASEQLE